MIVDAFMYFNEKDIAYLRIKELYDKIDYFVINEATKTHQGQDKSLSFWKDERLKKFKDKIIYSPIELDGRYDSILPKYFPDGVIGAKEHEQRIRLYEQIDKLGLEDKDFILISDCDEIPNKQLFEEMHKYNVVAFNQMFFIHYINLYTNKNVTGTVAMNYGKLKEVNKNVNNMGLQIARRDKDFIPRIENGGWHYSYMGGPRSVSQKVVSTYDGNLNSPWKSEKAAESLITEAVRQNRSPFSQQPTTILKFDTDILFLEFITAKSGQWVKDQGYYRIYPHCLQNDGKNDFKSLLYINE